MTLDHMPSTASGDDAGRYGPLRSRTINSGTYLLGHADAEVRRRGGDDPGHDHGLGPRLAV